MSKDLTNNTQTIITKSGLIFCCLLSIVFIILKLCGVITWKWIWVLFPLIIEAGFFIFWFIIGIILLIILSKDNYK